MSYEKKADRRQLFLFPPSVEDWVPPDHPARFIAEFVDSLDLKELGIQVGHCDTGRPRYSSELLLAVFIYCYFERIRSFRGMEKACLENIAVMWLTGLERPDHNTLWRFFRDNKQPLRSILKQSVKVAAKAELVGMVLHAVDGTKIEAQASGKSAYYRTKLEKALKRVDASIKELEDRLEAASGDAMQTYRLPEELADATKRRNKIRKCLAELDEADRNSLNPHERDARVMKTGGKRAFAYNGQAVTDAKAGVIVAGEVVNQETDNGLLVPMLESVTETAGDVAETTLADKGYSAAEDLAKAEEEGFDVLVNLGKNVDPPEGEEPFHTSRFSYDPERDSVICPLGQELPLQRVKKNRRGGDSEIKVYHCRSYEDCPRRWECSTNKRGRTIELGPHHGAVTRQRERQRSEDARKKLARRGVIAEPPFAIIKTVLEFRRWSYRDLDGNRTQWSLLCATVNLRKIYRKWRIDKALPGAPSFAHAA